MTETFRVDRAARVVRHLREAKLWRQTAEILSFRPARATALRAAIEHERMAASLSATQHVLKHIACIDDDEDILRVAELTLETMGGFKVTTFPSGASALAGLAAAVPDLVLLDVMMPTMDGPTTLEAIKRHEDLKHLPVIFLTARILPSERLTYEAMGATGVLAKPFDPATLAQQIGQLWRSEPTGAGK